MSRQVWVHYEPERQTLLVYIQEGEERQGKRLFRTLDGVTWVERGNEPPYFMRIDEDVAKALGEALAPRPEATERHLDDALQMRDRIFTLLEAQLMAEMTAMGAEHVTGRRHES